MNRKITRTAAEVNAFRKEQEARWDRKDAPKIAAQSVPCRHCGGETYVVVDCGRAIGRRCNAAGDRNRDASPCDYVQPLVARTVVAPVAPVAVKEESEAVQLTLF